MAKKPSHATVPLSYENMIKKSTHTQNFGTRLNSLCRIVKNSIIRIFELSKTDSEPQNCSGNPEN